MSQRNLNKSVISAKNLAGTTAALTLAATFAASLAGCASSGSFSSYDRDGNGLVSLSEADGRIYYFDSYDKNKDGGLDETEFKWAHAAARHQDEKDSGVAGQPKRRSDGILSDGSNGRGRASGGVLGTGVGGGFGN